VFFYEIDSSPLACQAKVLRFLQDKNYHRLGETRLRHANVRIIAATNADLVAAVRAKSFREDLFFRLRVARVEVPPLAQRPGDIFLLVAVSSSDAQKPVDCLVSKPVTTRSNELDGTLARQHPRARELHQILDPSAVQLAQPVGPSDLPLLGEIETGSGLPALALTAVPLKASSAQLSRGGAPLLGR
jgi:transcriptional regulator with GAF, ATPase, and Fis domain